MRIVDADKVKALSVIEISSEVVQRTKRGMLRLFD
jgi:hypothetical protein